MCVCTFVCVSYTAGDFVRVEWISVPGTESRAIAQHDDLCMERADANRRE